MLHAKANASIDLTGGITCRSCMRKPKGKQHQRQGDHGYRRCGTILFLRNRHPHGQLHKGRTGQCVARKHRAEGLQAMDATASVTGEGTVSCHATRKIEGEVNGTGSISYKGRPRIICKTPSGRDHINPNKIKSMKKQIFLLLSQPLPTVAAQRALPNPFVTGKPGQVPKTYRHKK